MLRRLLTFLGYFGLTILVVAVTVGLVAYGNGYTYNFGTHKIEQTGLVIISSVPSSLDVSFDNRSMKKKTQFHGSYLPGTYTFGLTKDGFWPWAKTLKVVAGQVTLAQYAILVPKKPAVTVLDTKPQITAQSLSKDHRHLAYVTGGPTPALYTLDLGNPKPVRVYSAKVAVAAVPATALADATPAIPAEVITGVEWSDDASHLLIISQIGGKQTHQLIAAGGSDLKNLTDQYRFDFTGLKFSSSNWRQLYWVSPDGLRRLDVEAQTVSAVLASNVNQFWIQPDRVLYVQQTDLGRSLWSLDSRGHHQELIQALVESDSYSVAYANYRGNDELAIVPSKTGIGTLYSGIFGDTPVAKTVARGVVSASFSPDGHLLAFSAPTEIFTYDLERSSIDGTFTLYSITDQPGQLDSLTWFDNYHLLNVRDGRLYWSEYDGANKVDLGLSGGLPANSTADFKSVIEYRPDGANMQIVEQTIKQ